MWTQPEHAALLRIDQAHQDCQQFYTIERRKEQRIVREQLKVRPDDEDLLALSESLAAPGRALDTAIANAGTAKETRDELRSLAAPSPKALAELAKAVSTIHEIRYRAVGDLANKSSGEAPTKQSIAQIIVNMPGAISQPREKRAIEVHPTAPQELGDGT